MQIVPNEGISCEVAAHRPSGNIREVRCIDHDLVLPVEDCCLDEVPGLARHLDLLKLKGPVV